MVTMVKFLFTVTVLAFYVAAAQAAVCTTDSDCGSNECCYIKPEFMVVSKRQGGALTLPQLVTHGPKTGVCETYRSLHDRCYSLEKVNGNCECPDDMSSRIVPAEMAPPPVSQLFFQTTVTTACFIAVVTMLFVFRVVGICESS